MPLESSIKKSVMRELEKVPGCVVRKRHGTAFGVAGDPDLYGTICGRHFELELKRPGEGPTPLQILRLEEWRKAGAIVGVAHSVKEAREVLGI